MFDYWGFFGYSIMLTIEVIFVAAFLFNFWGCCNLNNFVKNFDLSNLKTEISELTSSMELILVTSSYEFCFSKIVVKLIV